MMITTHARIAICETRGYFSWEKRMAILIGSVLPDIVSSSLPHRGKNLEHHIAIQEEKIRTSHSFLGKYIHLGKLLHYLCDYFCYAHQDGMAISHGIRHTMYEWKVARLYHSGFEQIPKKLPFKTDSSLAQYFYVMRKLYDKEPPTLERDVSYSLYAVRYGLEHVRSYYSYCRQHKKQTQTA